MRRFVVANWKMHPASLTQAKKIFSAIARSLPRIKKTRIVICPPTPFLGLLASGYRGSKIAFGAQDVSTLEDAEGAHTGETSAAMLAHSGMAYTIIGHSERRARGETDTVVSHKTHAATDAGLTAIVCVGESSRDDSGDYLLFLKKQLHASLAHLSPKQAKRIVIAYEPLWAIGKHASDAVTPDELHQTALYIRKILVSVLGKKIGKTTPILYGGAVEPDNAPALAAVNVVAGFLIGHASLKPKDFKAIISAVEKA